ncbi:MULTISPECIES: DEAD/DEAH box helicase family protein [unclassified Commensalibacter]|uniref:restriction endonuclease n=1 Tax=unclassified Commensalibacter TaxID=2630218 RepID=UPI0018DB6665|nr:MULTISPECIES: DEAD/DEAH box helicase family protein [unclassified Commensalibacter]MBI0016938.1 DEAD/DEAH box helicase family protein [Commensalibacter sp. B14384M2]MBI0018683.1 DEAD/DEAH box helicase family protein [Commensalibacter sp. W8133]MBI0049935.1 DEAD/DEAH box helicase family protein [Commensalibacter sp. B14384M3]MBI0179119.1 DEAD/DEAH box helicase family protein [Commensalibacter sp. W8163]
MKLEFEANLEYQKTAISAVVELFKGQSKHTAGFNLYSNGNNDPIIAVKNNLDIDKEQIFQNLQEIQEKNGIAKSRSLDSMDFSVEMETGTGKTYVYLRTIYELNAHYGFSKFIIVVPSIAIREGVQKSLEITHAHFQNIYAREPLNYTIYNSKRPVDIKDFAQRNNIEIIVMNIDSFAKDQNVINKINETGHKLIEYIQATSPVVIIDEPQNMETEKRKEAIKSLNGLCHLRYSATHKHQYNSVYQLDPVKAYDLGLVKQIEVDSIYSDAAFNDAYVFVGDFKTAKTSCSVKLTIHVNDKVGVKKKTISAKVGDDLFELSNHREVYKDGYILNEMNVQDENITFSNGITLYKGLENGNDAKDDIKRFQIRRTIKEHLAKEAKLSKDGIKVLSLFFMDKVSNYRDYEENQAVKGKYALWFEEIYREEFKKCYKKDISDKELDRLHNGYFSQDKKGILKDTKGNTQADDDTYSLIMKDKEKLLDINEPLRFIFSHSALREGWDNPNVFQICTLNETTSEMKKRQEIGRGLRLAVDKDGKRIRDKNINRLTVIANESYDDFAKALQSEIEEDCGVNFQGRIKDRAQRTKVIYKKNFQADPLFLAIWNKIKYKTTYRVHYDTNQLIDKVVEAIKILPKITEPILYMEKVSLNIDEEGIQTNYLASDRNKTQIIAKNIPDIFAYIENKTQLTRTTILEILKKSERIGDISKNPQDFLDKVCDVISREMQELMINGIRYQKVGLTEYEMKLFDSKELEIYMNDNSFQVTNTGKTIYENIVPLDSETENQFAKECETSEQVKYYFKLPNWFKIKTPIGNYNPDWALVFENDAKIYFVVETKNTGNDVVDLSKLSKSELLKIKCGKAHFKIMDDVRYEVVTKVSDLSHI